nr:hypothetical protein [Paramyrothecium roridum]
MSAAQSLTMPSGISTPLFDTLSATASQLRQWLDEGSITSVQIIESYLCQFTQHNTQGAKCRAVTFMPPRPQLVAWAVKLDKERMEGKLRGPLHGVPILLKDVFATDPNLGMPTTAGSFALLDADPPGNCQVVQKPPLRNYLVEVLTWSRGLAGWSAVGGMCQPAYVPTGYRLGDKRKGESTPAGSSTGSAVGVACGFAPISLGSETSGSLVSPSSNASLYALKLTPGSNSLQGILALTSHFETIGAIGKSALDVALACDALANMDEVPTLASAALSSKPDDLSVGFVDIEQWRLPEGVQNQDPEYYKQTAREYLAAKELLKDYGTKVSDVYITHPEKYLVGDFNANDLMSDIIGKFERALHKFHLLIKCISAQEGKAGIERYLEHLEYSKARTLDAVVEFHMDHPQLEFDKDYCPNQDRLINLINKANPKERLMERLDACKQWAATDGIDKVVQEHGVDVVVCCSDSFFAGVSVAARYPMAAMPLGYIASSGRPYGLLAIAKANEEAKLVKLMAIWNAISSPRRVPNLESCAKARQYL